MSLTIQSTFESKILTAEYVEEAIDLFSRSFCQGEPITHHLGLQYDDFEPLARVFLAEASKQGLSMVIVEKTHLVALAIVEDVARPLVADLDSLNPKFGYVFGFLEQLTHTFFYDKTFKEKNLAHLFVSAVHPDHQGKGLSRKVNFAAIEQAAKEGFHAMCCEFTHSLNEQGTVKYIQSHKVLLGSQVYSEAVIKEERPFVGLSGGANAYLWELKIGGILRYTTKDSQESFIAIRDVKI